MIAENTIQGKSIYLRTPTGEDIPELLKWRNSEDYYLCSIFNKETVSEKRFIAEMIHEFKTIKEEQFMIVVSKTEESIGTIWAYDYSEQLKHITIAMYLDNNNRNYLKAVETYLLMINYYFTEKGIDEIKHEVFKQNTFTVDLFGRLKFVEMVGEKDDTVATFILKRKDYSPFKEEYKNIFSRCLNQR
jgi:RimJ/RimL family protein N-acetyltransferase